MYLKYKFSNRLNRSSHFLLLSIIFLFPQISCKKLVTVDGPVIGITSATVFEEDATAVAAVTTMYPLMLVYLSTANMSIVPAVASDELTLLGGAASSNTQYIPAYTNLLKPLTLGPANFSPTFYQLIYTCNSAIEGLTNSKNLTPGVKQQMMGEAKFMRAFFYFYLVNYYGDVPLAITTDYSVNTNLPRASIAKVYEQIISDLKEAQTLLSDKFLQGDGFTSYPAGFEERVRPTKWAATALLARAYLYTEDWMNAEVQATSVIDNSALFQMSTLDNTFLKNNAEAIWQIQPTGDPNYYSNTEDGLIFIMPETGPNNYNSFYLSDYLLNAIEAGDERMNNWINSVTVGGETYYYPYKYKQNRGGIPVTEYTTVLRLAEQYLIRAEARAQQNSIVDAAEDLDIIRHRANLPGTTATNQEDMLKEILHENQVEFFSEWGHRWLDLKRTHNVDAVMSEVTAHKGGAWNTNWQWFPFPVDDLTGDPNLVQNPGY